MRRPVMYLAGLLMATGASLALAGPASAAPAHNDYHHHKCHHGHNTDWWDGGYSDDDSFSYNHQDTYGNGNQFYGINLLSGVTGGGLL
jgi:hypothetical protein